MDNLTNEAQQQQYHLRYLHSEAHQLSTAALSQAYDAYYAYQQHYDLPDSSAVYHHHHYYPHDYPSSSAAAGYHPSPPSAAAALTAATAQHHPASTAMGATQIQHHETVAYGYVQPHEQLSAVASAQDMIPLQKSGVAPGSGARFNHWERGRRGCGNFRDGGRVNYGHSPLSHQGAPPFRGRWQGRGRGLRGRGRKFHQAAPSKQLTDTANASVTGSCLLVESEPGPVQAAAVAPMPAPLVPRPSPFPIAWCDICRVECTNLDILEQHKNGKRHKKTLQKIKEIEARQKQLMVDVQGNNHVSLVTVTNFSSFGEGNIVPYGLENSSSTLLSGGAGETFKGVAAPVNMANAFSNKVSDGNENPAAAGTGICSQVNEADKGTAASGKLSTTMKIEHTEESQVQVQIVAQKAQFSKGAGDNAGMSTAAITLGPAADGQKRRLPSDGNDKCNKKHGPKRKLMKFGPGGKRLRTSGPIRMPPERQRERPRVCTVCNATCDTQAVFESHLSGKKHITRMKRFQHQDTVFGPLTVYIPLNQPVSGPAQVPEPLFFGITSREMLQPDSYHGVEAGETDASVIAQSENALQDIAKKFPADKGEEPANRQDTELYTNSASQEFYHLPEAVVSGASLEDDSAEIANLVFPEHRLTLGDASMKSEAQPGTPV